MDSTIMRSSDQVSTSLGEEVVILSLKSEEYFGLKDVGAYIWNIIQEPKTVKDILEAIVNEYDVEPERCKGDLLALLEQLAEEGIIEVM
ncbi:MAG: PqqD family protein [bacterium]